MANTNNPYGFIWHGLGGDAVTPSSGLAFAKINSANTNTFGQGDPILRKTSGNQGFVDVFTNGTAGYNLLGVFQACEYYSTAAARKVWRNYYPGSDATGDVTVYFVPAVGAVTPRFLVQSSGATGVTTSSVGLNTDIKSGTSTAGTVTSGFYRSACTIDLVANFSTTTSLPFRIVGLYSDYAAASTAPGADTTTQFNWVLVEANNYALQGV
jgi:hypothetical protein